LRSCLRTESAAGDVGGAVGADVGQMTAKGEGLWKVVGGGAAGGIIVRTGKALSSQLAASGRRLATESLVRQLALEGDRLCYELVVGEGPLTGWVSLRTTDRELIVRASIAELHNARVPFQTDCLQAPSAGKATNPAAEAIPEEAAAPQLNPVKATFLLPNGPWHEVLGVPPEAKAEEVRRAFRELALTLHPDKQQLNGVAADDGGEAFRRAQEAYEDGLRAAAIRALTVASRAAGGGKGGESELQVAVGPARGLVLPVPLSAPRARLREACDAFERLADLGRTETVPDEVSVVTTDVVAEWLCEDACVVVDTREPSEKFGKMVNSVPGAVALGYTELLKRPEATVPTLELLRRHLDRGLRLVEQAPWKASCGPCHHQARFFGRPCRRSAFRRMAAPPRAIAPSSVVCSSTSSASPWNS